MAACRICGGSGARVRASEIATARISGRAHVDCAGHSEYRAVTRAEIDEAAHPSAELCFTGECDGCRATRSAS